MARRRPSYLSLTDLFCGAGGASIGAELAGVKLALGVNHWDRAILTHSANFPDAAHDCRDLSETHPSRYGSTHILWASPECPKWSQARGAKRDQGVTGQLPLDDGFEALPSAAVVKSRVTMWDVVRYAEYHAYEAVVVENVVDVMPWVLLPSWFQAMETLGYAHRTLFLNSMFFGVPQSRDRWYVVFWKRGNPAPDLEFRPSSWCAACGGVVEATQSFKKPKRWTDRYGRQYLYLCPVCAGTALPFVTPALAAIDWSVLGERIGDRKDPLAEATMRRIQAGIDRYWNRPVVFDELHAAKHRDALVAPLATQTGRQSQALYIPLVTHLRGTQDSHVAASARPASDPMRTISAEGNHHGLLTPLHVRNYTGGAEMSRPVDDPFGAITAVDHHALLSPAGGTWRREPSSIDEPMPTRTARDNDALVTPPLVITNQHENRARLAPDEPLPTVTTGTTTGLVVGIERGYHGREHQHVREAASPLSTLTKGHDRALVTAYYGGSNVNRLAGEPMPTHRGVESHALVERGDEPVRIEDCSFRMLMPPEIGRGMAFRDDYTVTGNQRERVQQYGQAVTPPVARWLLERVVESLR